MTEERIVEQEIFATGDHDISTATLKARNRTLKVVVVCLILCCIMMVGILHTQYQISEQQEKELCLMAAIVDLWEDRLFLLYGKFPEEVGFGELKDAWIDNPCYDTLSPYYNALKEFFEAQEGDGDTPIFTGEMINA